MVASVAFVEGVEIHSPHNQPTINGTRIHTITAGIRITVAGNRCYTGLGDHDTISESFSWRHGTIQMPVQPRFRCAPGRSAAAALSSKLATWRSSAVRTAEPGVAVWRVVDLVSWA